MIRVDIYAHEALEGPLMETLCPVPPDSDSVTGTEGRPFTLIHHVAGRGASGSSMGNEVWPETNLLMILYLEDGDLGSLKLRIADLRTRFPRLGLAVFATRDWETI